MTDGVPVSPPGVLSFGLPADEIRVKLASIGSIADAPGYRDRLTARVRCRVHWVCAKLLDRLVPRVEVLIPWRLVSCPICAWTGLAFRPLVGPGWMQTRARCPSCGGVQRHRLIALAYRES